MCFYISSLPHCTYRMSVPCQLGSSVSVACSRLPMARRSDWAQSAHQTRCSRKQKLYGKESPNIRTAASTAIRTKNPYLEKIPTWLQSLWHCLRPLEAELHWPTKDVHCSQSTEPAGYIEDGCKDLRSPKPSTQVVPCCSRRYLFYTGLSYSWTSH